MVIQAYAAVRKGFCFLFWFSKFFSTDKLSTDKKSAKNIQQTGLFNSFMFLNKTKAQRIGVDSEIFSIADTDLYIGY